MRVLKGKGSTCISDQRRQRREKWSYICLKYFLWKYSIFIKSEEILWISYFKINICVDNMQIQKKDINSLQYSSLPSSSLSSSHFPKLALRLIYVLIYKFHLIKFYNIESRQYVPFWVWLLLFIYKSSSMSLCVAVTCIQ